VFDFNALKTHYIGKKRLGVLTALEEVELGTMIQAREQAKGLLAQAETMYIALDPGEHEQCLADIKTGSLAADIFARANEGMIRKIAYAVYQQYSQEMPRLEMKELRQQARFILSRSIAKFDPAWGVKFSSFAQQYIYLKMLGWARDNGIEFDRHEQPEGDAFACRYEANLTDPKEEPRKTRWDVELAFRIVD